MSCEKDYEKYWKYIGANIQEDEVTELRAIKNEGGACDRIFSRQQEDFSSFTKKWSGKAHIFSGINPRAVSASDKVNRANWFVLDIDNPGVQDLETLKSFRPRFIVASGNGYHAYFSLSSVGPFVRDVSKLRNAEAIKRFAAKISGKCDRAVSDPERVMRVPGTINLKNGKEAHIIYEGEQNPKFQEWYDGLQLPSASEQDFSLACNMARKGLDKESIKEAIREWRGINGDEKGKAERGDYLDRTATRALRDVVPRQQTANSSARSSGGLSFSDTRILENIQETRWLVNGLLPEASLSYICGDPKSRKSWLALYMGLCVAMGRRVLDQYEVVQSPVLYIQLEDGLGRVGVRYSKLTLGLGGKPPDDKFRLYVGSELKFNREDTWGQVLEFCTSFKPKLVIIDTLAKSHTALENDATEMSVVLDRFCKLRDMFGATVLIVHHLKKPGQNDRSKRYMAGSRVIEASAESMLFVESDPKKNQSDVAVISKSAEEFGFSYKVVDDIVDSKPCVRLLNV